MSTWSTAINDLRIALSDQPTDKLRWQKKVFGLQNASNATYKTFEFRRVTDFTQATSNAQGLGIYLNGVLQPASSISSDNPEVGFFVTGFYPANTDTLAVSYYIQWFLDSELDEFLTQSAAWMGLSEDYTQIPSGLKPAALKYGAYQAYQKLALKYAETMGETYRLEDSADPKRMEIVSAYQRASKDSLDAAVTLRDDFYTRKGMAKAPLFSSLQGRITDVPPRR